MRIPRAVRPAAKQRGCERAGRGELAANNHSNDEAALRPAPGTPWFTAMRSEDAWELLLASRSAFVLAYVVAFRARWKEGFNRHGLDQGEAMLGDYAAYGMTKQEYRTAKKFLAKWHFATFRPTPKGTVARLADTRLFSLLPPARNTLDNTQPTHAQHTPNTRLTPTGRKEERSRNEKTGRNAVVETSFVPGQPANP